MSCGPGSVNVRRIHYKNLVFQISLHSVVVLCWPYVVVLYFSFVALIQIRIKMKKEIRKPSFFSPNSPSSFLPSYPGDLGNVSLPYNVFIPDELKSNKLLSRFVRRLVFKVDRYYQQKYLNLSDTLYSFNGPVYLPVLHSVLEDQNIEYNLFNLLTVFYVLGSSGKLPVRIKAIQKVLCWPDPKTYYHLARARQSKFLKRQHAPHHPDGSSYQLTYQAVALLQRVHKLFYTKVLTLPVLETI